MAGRGERDEVTSYPVMATWAKMAAAQANLFPETKMADEAEEVYRLATQIYRPRLRR